MTRIMGDGVIVENIPLMVDLVAVDYNGLYAADPAKVAARFPPSKYVTVWIDINASAPEHCQVLDVEKGDAGPNQAPGWIKARRAVVHTSLPTIYCDRSTLPAVTSACFREGLRAGTDYQLWIATLDGTHYRGPGVVACQYEGGPNGAYDLSVVYDDKWHPMPKAAK